MRNKYLFILVLFCSILHQGQSMTLYLDKFPLNAFCPNKISDWFNAHRHIADFSRGLLLGAMYAAGNDDIYKCVHSINEPYILTMPFWDWSACDNIFHLLIQDAKNAINMIPILP
jgi:hypothetical protein